jgi:hypothetical protein
VRLPVLAATLRVVVCGDQIRIELGPPSGVFSARLGVTNAQHRQNEKNRPRPRAPPGMVWAAMRVSHTPTGRSSSVETRASPSRHVFFGDFWLAPPRGDGRLCLALAPTTPASTWGLRGRQLPNARCSLCICRANSTLSISN